MTSILKPKDQKFLASVDLGYKEDMISFMNIYSKVKKLDQSFSNHFSPNSLYTVCDQVATRITAFHFHVCSIC